MTSKSIPGGIILLVIFLLVYTGCRRDPKSNEDIFSQLEGQEGVYTFKVPAALFLMLARAEVPSGELVDRLGDIEIVKLLMFDPGKSKSKTAGDISNEIFTSFGDFGYEMVIRVTYDGSDFAAYILENDKYVTDLMVVITDRESVTSIGLTGKLDSDSITDFASVMDYGKLKEMIDIHR